MLQIGTLLVILLSLPSPATAVPDSLTIRSPDDATVQGVIVENVRGCERDLPCTLRLAVHGRPIEVIYHHGDSEQQCLQPDIVTTGLALHRGERIVARGRYRQAGPVGLIDVCTAPGAQLQRVAR